MLAARPLLALALLATLAGGAVALTSTRAEAKAAYDSSYGYERTWNATLRMLRVDMGFKIVEKDDQGGYILFEYTSAEAGNRPSSGSVELVHGREAEDPVKVIVQLVQMPQYHEQMLADSLATKMRQEYGDPPRRKPVVPPPPAPAVPDAGADAG